jgi:hypothetical protein
LEQFNQIANYLENPTIRFAAIGVFSTAFAGIYVLRNKMNSFKYDTITDLKKKAKAFTKMNYQQDKNKSKSGF